MFVTCAVVGAVLAPALAASAFLTFTGNEAITASMTELGVPDAWLPSLAALKAASTIGVVLSA
ncbi:DoxX family protein [Streptomyces sp. NPDC050095]|uniref:DoxX family protein n=1 Tax=unclassified Streptomyces TaxID=2593676 RepID=UPI003429E209